MSGTLQLSKYYRTGRPETDLYTRLYDQAVDQYGLDLRYVVRDIVSRDLILNEDYDSKFRRQFAVKGYFEEVDEYGGDGDLIGKFGFEMRDECVIVLSRSRWEERYQANLQLDEDDPDHIKSLRNRPLEGDLIYIPFSRSLFEIRHVEHEQPFYQAASRPAYRLFCELFEYGDEDFEISYGDDTDEQDRIMIEEDFPPNQVIAEINNEDIHGMVFSEGKRFWQPLEYRRTGDTWQTLIALGYRLHRCERRPDQNITLLQLVDPEIYLNNMLTVRVAERMENRHITVSVDNADHIAAGDQIRISADTRIGIAAVDDTVLILTREISGLPGPVHPPDGEITVVRSNGDREYPTELQTAGDTPDTWRRRLVSMTPEQRTVPARYADVARLIDDREREYPDDYSQNEQFEAEYSRLRAR